MDFGFAGRPVQFFSIWSLFRRSVPSSLSLMLLSTEAGNVGRELLIDRTYGCKNKPLVNCKGYKNWLLDHFLKSLTFYLFTYFFGTTSYRKELISGHFRSVLVTHPRQPNL